MSNKKPMINGESNIRYILKKTLLSWCLLLIFIVSVFVACSTFDVNAKEDIKVTSINDYYDKLARQIYDRDLYRSYIVDDLDLVDSILHINMAEFSCHYNPDDPLVSGCYLMYYTETIFSDQENKRVKVRIKFPYNKREMDAHFEKLDRLSSRLKGKSDYDTVKNVHDYLIENFEYDHKTSMVNHTDIDGFRDGVMVCSGYGLAAYYLLNKAGVETRIITGYGGDGTGALNHMWNAVKLDGKWYNLDITWDDLGQGGKIYTYFLKSDDRFPRHVRMGKYDVNGIPFEIASRSYRHPFFINNPEDISILLFGIFIIGIVIYVYIQKLIKKRMANYAGQGYVVNNEFEVNNEFVENTEFKDKNKFEAYNDFKDKNKFETYNDFKE